MTFSDSCLRFFVSGANFTFALGGLALVIVGVLYKLNLNGFTDAIPNDYEAIGLAPTLTIVIGAIIFFIAFFGCCGAIRESPCLLTTYAIILLIIFLLQIAVGVFVFIEIKDKADFEKKVNTQLEKVFTEANTKNQTWEVVNLIQDGLECCGVDGPSFWSSTPPATCYDSNNKLYKSGCKKLFYSFLVRVMNIIGITVLALSALEVIGCVLTLCLSSSIKNRERRFRY